MAVLQNCSPAFSNVAWLVTCDFFKKSGFCHIPRRNKENNYKHGKPEIIAAYACVLACV